MTLSLTGRRFGRLLITHSTKERAGKSIIWAAVCDCGNKDARISARDLLHSKVPRRGCGSCKDTEHPLYAIWSGIKFRTSNKEDKNYGGRGISLHSEWNDFRLFLSYIETNLGTRPPGWSIDRIDVNGNYEPGNIRWASALVQAQNKRNIPRGLSDEAIWELFLSFEPIKDLAIKYQVSLQTIKNIRCFHYSEKATQLCLNIPEETKKKFSRKISAEALQKLNALFPKSPS